MGDEDRTALIDSFASFGADLGVFLEPFVSKFRADAVLITGGIAEAWDLFAPSLIGLLAVPAVKATLGRRAALLGAAALYRSMSPLFYAGDFCVQDLLCLVLACQFPKQIDFNFVSRYNHIVWGRKVDW